MLRRDDVGSFGVWSLALLSYTSALDRLDSSKGTQSSREDDSAVRVCHFSWGQDTLNGLSSSLDNIVLSDGLLIFKQMD